MNNPIFHTYILTNWRKTVLYTGVTNNLPYRLIEHYIGAGSKFTSQYFAYNLVWYESTKYILNAIHRENEIKCFTREEKIDLITSCNPEWKFFNLEIIGNWPPCQLQIDEVKERWKNDNRAGFR